MFCRVGTKTLESKCMDLNEVNDCMRFKCANYNESKCVN